MSDERRQYARVAVPVLARVVIGKAELEFKVRDMSRRGIFLYSETPPGRVGTVLTLKLSMTAGIKPISVSGMIVRLVKDPDKPGKLLGLGLRFVEVDSLLSEQLLSLLERSMMGPGTMNRAYPRVHHLMSITCRTQSELKAVMHDIGEGGVGLVVDRPLVVNEEATLTIPRGADPELKLHGWIVSSVPAPFPAGHQRVGVRLAKLAPEVRTELRAFLKKLYSR